MLTEQQRNQVFIASLRERADPNAIVPVKFNAYFHFVRNAQIYSKNIYYLVLAFVFIWSVLFVSFTGFLLFVVMLGSVNYYCNLADNTIKDACKWYWYEFTDNHLKVHSEGCVLLELDECSCRCRAPEKDAAALCVTGVDETTSSIPSEDAELVLDSVDCSGSHLSMRGGDDGAGATESHSNVLGEKDITVGFVGHDVVVGVDNTHVPKRNLELVVDHREGDNSHIGGDVVSVRPNLYFKVPEVDGNVVSSGILKDEVLAPSLSEDMDVDTLVPHSFDGLEIVSSDSVTSFSNRNNFKHDIAPRRSRSKRVRGLARLCSGMPRCVRLRPLRRFESIYSPKSPIHGVDYMEIDSLEMWVSPSLKEQILDVDNFDPMDIDSFESLSDGCDKESVVEEANASYSVGLPTIEAGGSLESTIADSQPCEKLFLKDNSVVQLDYSFVTKEETINNFVSLPEQVNLVLPVEPSLVRLPTVAVKEVEEVVPSINVTIAAVTDAPAAVTDAPAAFTCAPAAFTGAFTFFTGATAAANAATATKATTVAISAAATTTATITTAPAAITTTTTAAITTPSIVTTDNNMAPSSSRRILKPTNRLEDYKKKHKSTSFIKDYQEKEKTKADISALFDAAEEEEEEENKKKEDKMKKNKKKGYRSRFEF